MRRLDQSIERFVDRGPLRLGDGFHRRARQVEREALSVLDVFYAGRQVVVVEHVPQGVEASVEIEAGRMVLRLDRVPELDAGARNRGRESGNSTARAERKRGIEQRVNAAQHDVPLRRAGNEIRERLEIA